MTRTAYTGVLHALVTLSLLSGPAAAEPGDRAWQRKLLFSPSQAQLKRESRGGIFIYSGLNDTDVERAMEEQFDRVEHMMFIKTVVTDDGGEARKDKKGRVLRESDDC